jgi:UDP-N-acetylmuramoylalanine--D-glutamate ligase
MLYNTKKPLIIGTARSGTAAARLLTHLGADVTMAESGPAEHLAANHDLIVVSPGVPTDQPLFSVAAAHKIPVISEIELAYSACQNPILAITGTNGKTTTTAILGDIMSLHRPGSRTAGNIGTPLTEVVLDYILANDAQSFIVAEISSFQLETTHSFAPLVSAVLNISPDHLDRHKTMENYIKIKERIFANQLPHHFTVLNHNDPVTRGMAARTPAQTVYFNHPNDQTIINNGENPYLFGHNMENAMAAAKMAACAGVGPETIREALIGFKGYPHRIEYVAEICQVEYYNDSKATNPDSTIKAIQSMRRPIVLIAGGKDKDADFSGLAAHFTDKVKHIVVLGETADKIISAATVPCTKTKSLEEAASTARKIAESGDCVLLSPACASQDMFKDFEERGEIFKETIRKWDA